MNDRVFQRLYLDNFAIRKFFLHYEHIKVESTKIGDVFGTNSLKITLKILTWLNSESKLFAVFTFWLFEFDLKGAPLYYQEVRSHRINR